jgi:hypothetical protein
MSPRQCQGVLWLASDESRTARLTNEVRPMAVRAGLSTAFALLLTSGGSVEEPIRSALLPPLPPGPPGVRRQLSTASVSSRASQRVHPRHLWRGRPGEHADQDARRSGAARGSQKARGSARLGCARRFFRPKAPCRSGVRSTPLADGEERFISATAAGSVLTRLRREG